MKVLKKAEELRLKSVAFPLLGTGKWTTPAAVMAETILNAVGEFSINSKPNHLKLVRVTIFQVQMVDDFADAVTKKVAEKKSLVGRLKDWWGGAGDIEVLDSDDLNVCGITADIYCKIIFHIYGLSQDVIDNVIKEIEDTGKNALTDKVLESPDQQEKIAKLSSNQIARIKGFAHSHGVRADVEQGKRLNRIRLRGDGTDVATVLTEVFDILHEADLAEHKKTEAELIALQAHWEYQLSDSTFESYPPDINAIIEKAFQAKKPFAEWEEDDNSLYRVDFAQCLESKQNNDHTPVPVKRICDVPIAEPKHWDTMTPGTPFLLVNVPIGSKEYDEVENNIKSANPKKSINEILKIERVQNPNLYQQYAVRKMHLEAANGPKVQNERILWHGTSADTIQQINIHGFNRSYCGKNAVVYGKGVYFASQWWYSAQNTYSSPDGTSQKKYIYQTRVLVGEFALGKEEYIDTPLKPGSKFLRYDSVVNDVSSPLIFVIFRDSQAYPEYLITFI
jgi:poly [ADP-ribose] polymerase 10/14/15